MKLKNNLPHIIILVIVISAITFAGVKFFKKPNANSSQATESQEQLGSNNPGQSQGSSRGQRGGNRGNFKTLHGTVTSVSSDTIVMKADDASVKNIAVSADTRISRTDNGQQESLTISDVKSGDEINVMASDTTGNDITAKMIIIGTFTPPQSGGSGQGSGYNVPSTDATGQSSI